MVIETNLSRELFIRLSILRHIQRKSFYFYAILCAVLTAYALVQGPYILLLAAWIPFGLYLILGLVEAIRGSADKSQPYFLPTHYEFTKDGVSISTSQGSSQLEWGHFAGWKFMARCYVLILAAGPILAIPRAAVPLTQIARFETMLRDHIEG